jgi:raffinose/stachyose/melibiose transport system permease protein
MGFPKMLRPAGPAGYKTNPAARCIVYVILICWAVASLFPIYWMLTFSLKNNAEIFGENPAGIPREFRFSNYAMVFSKDALARYFLNSVLVTGGTIILVVMTAAMSTYAMIRMEWRLRGPAMSILMLGLMIPIHAALLPVFIMMRRLHILNTLWALIIPYTAFAVPMGIMIFSGFMNSIPREMEEAACIDGCNIYRIFFQIVFPLLRPAVATITIFTFLQSWNELMFAVVFISRDSVKTLTVGIQAMSGRYLTEWGPIGAALVVATVPTLLIYLFLSNQVQKSFIAGAVKG